MSVSWMSLLSGEGALCLGVLESAEVSVTGPSCGAWLLVKSAFPPGIRDSTGWGGAAGDRAAAIYPVHKQYCISDRMCV